MLKIYICDNPEIKRAYICRGVLMDFLWETYNTRDVIVLDRTVVNTDGTGASDDALEGQTEVWVSLSELEAYPGNVLADAIAADAGYEKYPLDAEVIPPLEFPCKATFTPGKGGRLGCRLNTHPERDGRTNVGIMVFPDKAWSSARAGEVRIDRVQERDTFGFVWGKQIKYDIPPLKEVIKFVASRDDLSAFKLYRLRGTPHGAYFGLADEGAGIFRRIERTEGGYNLVPYPPMGTDMIVGQVTPYDIEKESLAAVYGADVTAEDLFNQLVPCEFGPLSATYTRRLSAEWEYIEPDHDGDEDSLVRRAMLAELLSKFELPAIGVTCYEPQHVSGVAYTCFTAEEFNSLAETVKKHNESATEGIRSKLKAGKLRLQCTGK